MAIHYVNTGTALGALPMIKRDVNTEFAKPPTGTFEYLLRNLRGMEKVFDGITSMATEKYPRTYAPVPDQYVTQDFMQESAEKNRGNGLSAVDSTLLSRLILTSSTSNVNPTPKNEKGDVPSNHLYRLYQQAFELYKGISNNARSRANQVYNSAVESFKKLRQGIYRRDIGDDVQEGYRPNLRAKFKDNAKRVLGYLRKHGTDYLRATKRQHLPVQDLSVKGLEALLQEA